MSQDRESLVREARETAEELIQKATKEADRAWYLFFAPRSWRERKLQIAREYLEEANNLIESIGVAEEAASSREDSLEGKRILEEGRNPLYLELVKLRESGSIRWEDTSLDEQEKVLEHEPVEPFVDLNTDEETRAGALTGSARSIDVALYEAISRLTPLELQYMMLTLFNGTKTESEVAEMLGLSPASARAIHRRALHKLREDPALAELLRKRRSLADVEEEKP